MLKGKESYDPAQSTKQYESIAVRVFTKSGWILGNVTIPSNRNFLSVFENSEEYITMTDVLLEGRPQVIPIFSLQRSAVIFLKPEADVNRSVGLESRNRVIHPVSFLLVNGSVYGNIEISKGVRLSKHLSQHRGFLLVKNCHFRLHNPWEDRTIDHKEPTLLLNPSNIIGVSEWAKDEETTDVRK
jgi:hypothetical protein